MTTLYRPVLIESADQAEALPLGMVATSPVIDAVAIRVGYGLGWSVSGDEMSDQHAHMVGWTALVPIEAEEETARSLSPSDVARDGFTFETDDEIPERYYDGTQQTRLVTPWEEA